MFANTPKPPYYAVIFTSIKDKEDKGYEKMAQKMLELAKEQKGFLGVETAREEIGITVSYWKDLEAISFWKSNIFHLEAQQKGKDIWYKNYSVRIAKVEKDYTGHK